MDDLSFDDLIPQRAAPAQATAAPADIDFTDLVPEKNRAMLKADAADAPASGQPGDASASIGQHLISGLPIVGEPLMGALNRGIAIIRSVKNDVPYSKELENVQGFERKTDEAHPYAATGGDIAGGTLGTLAAAYYAPSLIGGVGANLATRALTAGLSNGLIGGADAAIRSGGDMTAAVHGAELGGALGAAAPLAGRVIGNLANKFTGGESTEMRLAREATRGIPEAKFGEAQDLRTMAASGSAPVDLTADEALNAVTNGQAGRLSQLRRVAANSGGEAGQIAAAADAARPGQIQALGQRTFNELTPGGMSTPTDLGFDLQAAALRGVAQTPEGMALQRARDAAGPRVTAEPAGQAIQADLRARAGALEAARSQQAATDYAAARAAPETVGMDGPPATVERPGEPIIEPQQYSRPQFMRDAPAPMGAPPARGTGAVQETGQPLSLGQFIARNGGLAADDNVLATDLHRFAVPGYGKVVRPDGKSIDNFWRERLIEEGYFRPDADGGMARDISSELLRKLQNEQRGVPSYPTGTSRSMAPAGDTYGQMVDDHNQIRSVAQSRMQEDLRRAGINPDAVHPDIRDRIVGQLARDPSVDGADAYEAVVSRMPPPPAPTVTPTTIAEDLPTVRWGQVDPRPAMRAVQEQQLSAKGDVRGALSGAERDLYAGGQPDMSVQGLLHARERADFAIQTAQEAGDRTKVRDLMIYRDALDRQLKAVPEVAAADANFAANSRPLEPFTGNGPLAQITRREGNQASARLTVPPENVPSMLSSPTASREAIVNGTPASRDALAGYHQTRILDGATDVNTGAVSSDAIRSGLRQNEDLLRQFPEVTQRLENIATRRDAMARIEASPIGKIASKPDVDNAVNALWPDKIGLNHHVEAGRAMAALARNNPRAAQELHRTYLETMFNTATEGRRGHPNLYGGAAYGSGLIDNPAHAKALEAVTRALPNGDMLWKDIENMAKVFKATGQRPQRGSDTAFNQMIQKDLASGKTAFGQAGTSALAGGAAGMLAGGPKGAIAGFFLGVKHGVSEATAKAQMARNGAAMARLLHDPKALPDLRALAQSPPGSRNAEIFTTRLLARSFVGIEAPLRQPAPH